VAAAEALKPPAAQYVGRFAPSPTGPLHAGSLVAAVASYADARANDGRWLLRIEDVDLPRCSAAAEREIVRQLAVFGFEHDGDVVRQSERGAHYEQALTQLAQAGALFACICTRKMLEAATRNSEGEVIYPGTCRGRAPAVRGALRLRSWGADTRVQFQDRAFGTIEQDVGAEVGDFVLKRADGLYAYQLAVVVDDALQGVTHVVRGADLLLNTPRQVLLQQRLAYARPHYLHVPLVRNAQGEKLSKQTRAAPLDEHRPAATLREAWAFLGQPDVGDCDSVATFWTRAIRSWDVQRLTQR